MDQATERVPRLNELYQVRRPARLYSSTCTSPTCTRDIHNGWSELAARNLFVAPYRNELLPQHVRMMIGSLGLPPQDLKASHPTKADRMRFGVFHARQIAHSVGEFLCMQECVDEESGRAHEALCAEVAMTRFRVTPFRSNNLSDRCGEPLTTPDENPD
jgi:hypothetical protein